ncbi:MAG: N-acetylmuramoyl-L-alanine amidase [Gemmatimonadota bacterium]
MRLVAVSGVACVVAVWAGFGIQASAERVPLERLADAVVAPTLDASAPASGTSSSTAITTDVRSALEVPPAAAAAPAVSSRPAPAPAPRPTTDRRRRRDRYWLDATFTAADWSPPEGPVRIALQAGHWRANEAPAELSGLRDNGTQANGKAEWEVNLEIARQAAVMLEELGYVVDVLPAVVPPSYRAHLFISIHADGSGDPRASGYRVAAPRNDVTGRAERAAEVLEEAYGDATGLRRLPTVTRRMSNYYAFNFRRYQHSLHPLTIGVILETGFLTSATDRRVIVDDPARAARGIVAAVTAFPETPPPQVTTPLASAAGASD